jgi:hypothetical protein
LRAFNRRSFSCRRAGVLRLDAHCFLLCRKLVAVVTFITPVARNSKQNLLVIGDEANDGLE